MAVLAPQKVTIAGTTVTLASASGGGDTLTPTTNSFLWVRTAGTAITVTVVVPGNDRYGTAKPDFTVSCGATGEKAIGPFDADLVDPATGYVSVTYSAVTNCTVAHVTI